jgi:hypothetical protein
VAPVTVAEILETDTARLAGILLPDRVTDLLWSRFRTLGEVAALTDRERASLPHLHSRAAQAELEEAVQAIKGAVARRNDAW